MSPHRDDIRAIIGVALKACDPRDAIRAAVEVRGNAVIVGGRAHPITPKARIVVVGAGKGSAALAAGLEDVLGEWLSGGHVTVKDGHAYPLHRVTIGEAAHPIPDSRGEMEADKALQLAAGVGAGDLVFALISGGGSALWPAPVRGLSLADKQSLTRALLASGASIDEMNAVRKHLSRIKGGQLARAVHPAALVGLLISDVIGDRLDVIASGPTVPDEHTFADALAVLRDRHLEEAVPERALTYITEGVRGMHPETPKPGDPIFAGAQTVVVANNRQALAAASVEARGKRYQVRVVSAVQAGDIEALGEAVCAEVRAWREAGDPTPRCLLWGGETTVVLPPNAGAGGRNQHLALYVARELDAVPGVTFASVGTDGTDGPTDAAGGIVDGGTATRVRAAGLDIDHELAMCNSYQALAAAGDLLVTGPTLTNVMDIQILLLEANER